MNTQHLRYAVEVEKTGSITQAADNLYIGQPSLSKAIKELEDTLGITIFKRTSKGAQPTAKGSEFLKYARNVLQQIEKMEALYKPESPDRQVFSAVIPRSSYAAQAVLDFTATLEPDKEIDMRVKETNSMRAIHDVSGGEFSLGVIRYQPAHEAYFLDFLTDKGLEHETVWDFELLVTVRRDHPLAASGFSAGALDGMVEIVHGDDSVPYVPNPPRESAGERSKKRICVYERGSQFELMAQIPDAYMWTSPIPQEMLDRYGLVQLRCADSARKCKDVLIYPRDRAFTTLDRRFIDKLFQARNDVAFPRRA